MDAGIFRFAGLCVCVCVWRVVVSWFMSVEGGVKLEAKVCWSEGGVKFKSQVSWSNYQTGIPVTRSEDGITLL